MVTMAEKVYYYNSNNQPSPTTTESSCSISVGECMQARFHYYNSIINGWQQQQHPLMVLSWQQVVTASENL